MKRDELIAKYPNASESFLRRNQVGDSGLRTHDKKPVEGHTLVGAPPRKAKGVAGAVRGPSRRRIQFRVFAVRPADWDGYSIKEIQDCLRHVGLLESDDWDSLQGEIISEKAYSKEEERTVVEIT